MLDATKLTFENKLKSFEYLKICNKHTFNMRIACVQFAPQVGMIQDNMNRVDSLLSRYSSDMEKLDYLVLPAMAFAGTFFTQQFSLCITSQRKATGRTVLT